MKNSIRDTFATATILLAITAIATLTLLLVGCDEAFNMADDVVGPTTEPEPEKPVPITTGDMKQPEEVQKSPEEPPTPAKPDDKVESPTPLADTTPPTVVEVTWYSDWQMTQPLADTSTVHPGDTIYTVVVFSEPVTHTVADDETARPALSIVTDDTTVQYKMLPHGVSFRSGEAKPINGGTDDFLCKYTVPADTVGTLALQIGSATTDLAGNSVAEVSEHIAPFVVTVLEPPTITIESVTNEENGSILVTGTGTNLPAGTVVTVTLGDIAAAATADEVGAWSATVPAEEAATLPVGVLIATTATAETAGGEAISKSMFENTPFIHGIPIATEAERIQINIVVEVFGHDTNLNRENITKKAEKAMRRYGRLNVESEAGLRTFKRFVEYEWKWDTFRSGPRPPASVALEKAGQYFEEAFGFPKSYARQLVYDIYLVEKPEDKKLLGSWQLLDISFEYVLIQVENPGATEEEILELLRESIRAGNVSIATSDWW